MDVMELGCHVGHKASQSDPGHDREYRGETFLHEIGRGRLEHQGHIHQYGHRDQGKEPDRHCTGRIPFSETLAEDIGCEEAGRIDDVAQGRLQTEQLYGFRDLDIRDYHGYGYPYEQPHLSPKFERNHDGHEIQQKHHYPQ